MARGVRLNRHPGVVHLPQLIPAHVAVRADAIGDDEEGGTCFALGQERKGFVIVSLMAVVERQCDDAAVRKP